MAAIWPVEVTAFWGEDVLGVWLLERPRSFYIGERGEDGTEIDFVVPEEKLGSAAHALIRNVGGVAEVVAPAHGAVQIEDDVGGRRDLAAGEGATLDATRRIRVIVDDLHFELRTVAPEKPMPRALFAPGDKSAYGYFALSFLSSVGIVAAIAWTTPALGLLSDEEIESERLVMIQQYLNAAAERNREPTPADEQRPSGTANDQSAAGAARGPSSEMGKRAAPRTGKRWSLKGQEPKVELPRAEALKLAVNFGMVGMLNAINGDPNATAVPWGALAPSGQDDESAQGAMWGRELGESGGSSGLGLTGIGEPGGGGINQWIGMGDIGTCGGASCAGLGPGGFGLGGKHTGGGGHATSAPRIRPGPVIASGRLPPEVVQRIVRQNFGRFRMCYERGLTQNPNLSGRVVARFVIDRSGAVSTAQNGGSDLPDNSVVSCVVSAFYNLSFPPPENGIVSVSYPIAFTPG